jgi:hypothetical protein
MRHWIEVFWNAWGSSARNSHPQTEQSGVFGKQNQDFQINADAAAIR